MPVVSDSVGFASDLPLAFDMTIAFPVSGSGRPPKVVFSESNTLPGCASVNASPRRLPNATHHSRPRRLARSCLVRLFHSLPFSGLRRRTLTPFSLPAATPGIWSGPTGKLSELVLYANGVGKSFRGQVSWL